LVCDSQTLPLSLSLKLSLKQLEVDMKELDVSLQEVQKGASLPPLRCY
jgi:hypothetical protein